MENSTIMHFVMFINTKSGNGDGKRFFTLGYPELVIHYAGGVEGHLYFIDLFSTDSRTQGLALVNTFMRDSADFRVIVCGGDGTIPWVLSELLNQGINLTRITFGIVPIGTGNDFSRSIGWGSKTVKVSRGNYKDLSLLVRKWLDAPVGTYDMWDVTVETFPNGKIFDIKNQREVQRQEISFKKMFSNYVGLGLDARVVYTVQRHRTPYAFLNKVAYGLVGCLNYFRCMKKLDQKVQSIYDQKLLGFTEQDGEGELMSTKQTRGTVEKSPMLAKYPIQSGKCGLVCLNCTSYMAGLRNVWKTKSISNVNIDKKTGNQMFKQQRVDDGMVQFVSFKNQLRLALERVIRSGQKVFQGSGPFEVKMKIPQGQETTHMQIDGESIKIVNLKSVIIKKTDKISDHKLRIMVGQLEN